MSFIQYSEIISHFVLNHSGSGVTDITHDLVVDVGTLSHLHAHVAFTMYEWSNKERFWTRHMYEWAKRGNAFNVNAFLINI